MLRRRRGWRRTRLNAHAIVGESSSFHPRANRGQESLSSLFCVSDERSMAYESGRVLETTLLEHWTQPDRFFEQAKHHTAS